MRARVVTMAAALVAMLASCAAPRSRPGEIEHVVLVWLKQPGDEAMKALLCDTARAFEGRIPGLVSVASGDALPITSQAHDQSFDLVFVMRFENAAALAGYETHPVHAAAKRDVLLPNAARVRVHDILLR